MALLTLDPLRVLAILPLVSLLRSECRSLLLPTVSVILASRFAGDAVNDEVSEPSELRRDTGRRREAHLPPTVSLVQESLVLKARVCKSPT